MSPKIVDNEERRNKIVEAAIKIFSRDGFQKARVDDIAKETGVAKGTLYLYFKSKEEIITHTIDQMFMGEFKAIDELIEQDLSALEKLTQVQEIVIKDYQKLSPFFPVMYEFYAYSMRKKGLKKAFVQYFEHYMTRLTILVQQGIDEGQFKPVDPREIAIAISAIYEGTLLLRAYIPDEIDLGNHTRVAMQTLLAGLLIEKN